MLVVNISPAHLFAVEQRVLAVERVETLREVFGAATNDVVRFLQCPDDIKFVAAPELPAHLEYTGKSVYMRLLSYNHMGSSHWDGRMPPCKTPDQIDG